MQKHLEILKKLEIIETSFFARGQRDFKLVLKSIKEEEGEGRGERERKRKRKRIA